MKINRIKKLLVSVLVCSMAFGNISYIPTMAKENVQNYGLNNPTTDSSGVSTWDCIYFGNYWQNDTNGDGVADKSDAKQPIKWRVLSVNGDDAFVVADQNLDSKAYNETKTDVTWENSTIRSWLNGYGELVNKDKKSFIIDNFLDNAFSGAEQNAIKTTYVVNEDNTDYGTDGGNNTWDKVYLLAVSEAANTSYGFDSKYNVSSRTREAKNTEYAKQCGAWTTTNSSFLDNGNWWLRTPGGSACIASSVFSYGSGSNYYGLVNGTTVAVRPALHINLSNINLWSYAGTVASDGTVTDATKGNMDRFNVGFNYVSDDKWTEDIWGEKNVDVIGDGNYSISYEAENDTDNIFLMILSTNLYKGALNYDFKLVPTYVTVGADKYKVNAEGGWSFAGSSDEYSYRYNIKNIYEGPVKDDCLTLVDSKKTSIDGLGVCPVKKGDIIKVYFTVTGMNKYNTNANDMPTGVATETPVPTKTPTCATTSPAITASPSPTPTATPSPTPTVKPTPSPTATPSPTPTVMPTKSPTATPIPTAKITVPPTQTPTESPDDDKEDAQIYAKSSVTKRIGNSKFYIDEGVTGTGEVTYLCSNKKVVTVSRDGLVSIKGCGKATITIIVDETDEYYGKEKNVKVTVLPGKVSKFKVKALSGGKINCTWKKQKYNNVKCQIQAANNSKFKKSMSSKTYPYLKNGKWTGKGLKRKKTFYFRIREVAKIGGKTYTGAWSSVKKVKIK